MDDTKKDRPVVGRGNSAGHVEIDSRGRNVWQWNDARIDIDSTTILLKRLDNDALELEATRPVPIPKHSKPTTESQAKGATKRASRSVDENREWSISESMKVDMGGGFDPYNRT
jgi:hypothetical protein